MKIDHDKLARELVGTLAAFVLNGVEPHNDIGLAMEAFKAIDLVARIDELERNQCPVDTVCVCGHTLRFHDQDGIRTVCSNMGAGVGIECPCKKFITRSSYLRDDLKRMAVTRSWNTLWELLSRPNGK